MNALDEVALEHAREWASNMMKDIPESATVTMITRQEYYEMLVLAYAMGFKQGASSTELTTSSTLCTW
jgi:hypothetical protein